MKILVVEDEVRVRDFLTRGLKAERHSVTEAADGEEGLVLARSGEFDVIVLDLMLPKMHGLDVCQHLREDGIMVPILMLTAMDELDDKVTGLRLGADDYMTKPFHFEELLARIEALARRGGSQTVDPVKLQAGDLSFDRETLEVHRAGRLVKLTAKELALLELLMSKPGKVFSRQKILSNVWGLSEDPLTNIVDVYLGRLRKKLEAEGEPALIETVRGHGYRLVAGATD
jgi:DNA-binding response OmpR family regulator